MQCPKCNGPMWDNTNSKKNPRSPDYKCKDKTCGEGVWIRDGRIGTSTKPTPDAPAATRTPGLQGLTPQQQANARQMVRDSYAVTMGYVAGFMQKISKESGIPLDMGHVQAATFSIYNTMDKKGLIPSHLKPPAPTAPKRDPEPPRRPAPPPPDEFDDLPQSAFEDDLPF